MSPVTSAWNWIPHAGLPSRRNDCRHTALSASACPARWQLERVVVPLEHGRAFGERAEKLVALPRLGQGHRVPADLRRAHRADGRAGGAREHLCAEADTEHGHAGGEDVLQERLLVPSQAKRSSSSGCWEPPKTMTAS